MTHLQRYQVAIGSPWWSSSSNVCLFSTGLGGGQNRAGSLGFLSAPAGSSLGRQKHWERQTLASLPFTYVLTTAIYYCISGFRKWF